MRVITVVEVAALAAAAVVVVVATRSENWDPWRLALITALTVTSDLTAVETGSNRLKVSGSFLGIMLAAVLLGGGPAAVVGILAIAIGWLRWREAGHYLLNNLTTYAWFPLLSGLALHAAIGACGVGPRSPAFYLLGFAAFTLALSLNFLGVAGYQCLLDGTPITHKAREALAPILASELFSALLTAAAVYVTVGLGTIGLAMFAVVLVVFQYLVGALLLLQRRSHDLQRMATTDGLTGLPNRDFFCDRLEEIIGAIDPTVEVAVLLMDLDHFKDVNDTLGHRYGDLLLRELGPRLSASTGDGDIVARLGGDEFAILSVAPADSGREAFEQLARRLLACVGAPVTVEELRLEVTASIGISRFPEDGADVQALLRCADIAMYEAKGAQTGYRFYTVERDTHSLRRLNVATDVRRGIASDQVVVHYQPKVDPRTLIVHGAEALVRWQHPAFGLLPPSTFIHTVEQTSLIGPLTRHVLQSSIQQCAEWRRGGRDLSVAVNLSVRNLLDRDLPSDIEKLLHDHSLPPEALELELTERMIMSDPDRALATLARLSALGVRLSVDDYGTGFSSLANLQRLPIDELKIDRSFVTGMLHDDNSLIIVRSTINLGHDLGLTVIAEGVEDEATLSRLSWLGCDLAQGFHLSPPLPALGMNSWLLGYPKSAEEPPDQASQSAA